MKTIRLISLDIADFKAQNIHVDFDPGATRIIGRNRAGKSTILDAILWCLLGIDSEGRANYRLFDENREFTPESSVPASVTLAISVDGDRYSLRRVARQQWTRRRSSSEYVKADTDEYRYYLDGVEIPAKDYASRVSELLCPPDKLRLILNITHYLRLKWQDLRRQFADIVGEITPDMFTGDYAEIDALVARYRSEDLARQSVANAISDHKKQLAAIRAAIDTIRAQYPDLSPVEQAKADIAECERQAQAVASEMADIQEYLRPYQEKYKEEEQRISDLKSSLAKAEAQFLAERHQSISRADLDLRQARSALAVAVQSNADAARDRDSLQKRIDAAQSEYDYWHAEYDKLRQQSADTRQWTFESSQFAACQFCGAPLAGKSLSEAKAKFDEYREHELLRIRNLGVSARSKWEDAQATLARLRDPNAIPQPIDLAPLHDAVYQAQTALAAQQGPSPAFQHTPICATISAQIADLEAHRTQIPMANTADLSMQYADLLAKIKSYMTIAALPAVAETLDRQIADKKAEQASVAQALADQERIAALFLDREREKASIIGTLANRHLSGASVTMTTLSKAGEIVDCCEVRDESGIGSSTTNSASQMRIGISLSRCFAAAMGLDMPVIVDNAERMDSDSLFLSTQGIPQIVTLAVADCPLTIQ